MSTDIPILRISDGQAAGEWMLVADGYLKPSVEHESSQATEDAFRMWNADVESIILQEFPSSGVLYGPSITKERSCLTDSKENFPPQPTDSSLCTDQPSGKVLKAFSPRKQGILTPNSGLCNAFEPAPKRQRQYEVSCTKQTDFQPMFQTASMKPVQISSSAMQKAKALLEFGDLERCSMYGEEFHTQNSSPQKSKRNLAGRFKRQSGDDTIVGGLKQSANVSARMLQTATGKAVPMPNTGKHKAMFRLDQTNNQQTGQGQPVLMSGAAVKQAPKLSERENLSSSLKSPSSSSAWFATGLHGSDASKCLFQTATGKAVSISSAGMHRAAGLLSDAETSKNDTNQGLNMFQTARGQSVSVSSTSVRHAAKLLGEENFSFPIEAPLSSPPMRFVTGKGQSVSVSSSAMKRAKDLLAGKLEGSDIIASPHLIKGAELDSHRVFETSEGHLIKVSSGSIQQARVLLNDQSLNTSMAPCATPFQNLDNNGFPSRKSVNALQNRTVQDLNFSTLNRIGAGPRKFVTCFKAPRRLEQTTPPASTSTMKGLIHSVKHDFSQLVNMDPLHKSKKQKSSYMDVFNLQPHQEKEVRQPAMKIVNMTSETAKSYKFTSSIHGLESVSSDEFRSMLLEVGANAQFVTKEWVENHYRWIVWKLASLERSYPCKVANQVLTIQRVFDELRYRYEREVNCSHRSALKKVTEGDAAPGRTMVLCVAAVYSTNSVGQCSSQSSKDSLPVQLEVTDGWYSLMAHLDQPLVNQLLAGKIFVGQKLKVCRAALIGCTTPMPPLEAFQATKLALHMNGTFRTHGMDKLGFCKGLPIPLAFHCIKPDGGLVPRTIIGIYRMYPVLYQERLLNRGSIIRSAKAEDLAVRGYHDRRNEVAEEAVIRMERENISLLPENEVEEGAKLFRLLENSAEPELLMADMSGSQHAAFAAYQAKREAARQSLTHKEILKALGDVHLDSREVTPFMKLSVMGLSFLDEHTREYGRCGRSTKGGIVTIWQVTDEQVESLKEGAVFCVSDLYPLHKRMPHQSKNTVLHLRATKTTTWQLLSQATVPHFIPRQARSLSLLGTLPFRSEFDVAVLIVHVGKPYACGIHQRQWLFVSDGSMEDEFSNDSQKSISLLAIDWSTSCEAFLPVERCLEGCIIGYCNLVKRCRDQRNCMWVADASESSIFSSNLSSGKFSHLKAAADGVNNWVRSSKKSIAELEERIHRALLGGS